MHAHFSIYFYNKKYLVSIQKSETLNDKKFSNSTISFYSNEFKDTKTNKSEFTQKNNNQTKQNENLSITTK